MKAMKSAGFVGCCAERDRTLKILDRLHRAGLISWGVRRDAVSEICSMAVLQVLGYGATD